MDSLQETTIATALKASINPIVVAALAIRDDVTLTNWLNTSSSVDAWKTTVPGNELFEGTNITKFDNLTTGKRDAWRLMLDFAPINFSRIKFRTAVVDTWGNVDSLLILQDFTRKATRAENFIGGNLETTNTVAALDLSFVGTLSVNDVSFALNRNP